MENLELFQLLRYLCPSTIERIKKKYVAEKFLIVVGFGVVVMAIVFISTWIFSMI